MANDIIIWWLVVQVFGLLGLPFTTFLFRSLPDRGYAFSKSLGLLLTGYGAWLLAMFGLGSFGVPLLIMVGLIVGGSGIIFSRTAHVSSVAPQPWLERLRAMFGLQGTQISWRLVLGYEAVFFIALVALAVIRSYYPDPWGTERPMDFAFFNAIRNSPGFPPQDPWLAGYSINYYYFGYLLMASIALLSGLDPAVGYNLSLALIFALTALGIAGILYNLITLSSSTRQQTRAFVRPLAAIIGIVLVLVVGNQAGALQVITGSERVVALNGSELVSALSQSLRGQEQIDLSAPIETSPSAFGEFSTLTREDRLDNFNWWWPSRVVWDDYTPVDGVRKYTITEFPFFSFWLGDMHPHVMALPFGLLAMALALATITRTDLPAFGSGRRGRIELILTGLILGSLYMINSWDIPTYVLLYLGALLLLYVRVTHTTIPWRHFGLQFGFVLLAAFGLLLPFYLTFRSLVGSAAPLIDLPILGRLTQIISPFTIDKTELHAFLIIFGLFVLPLVAFVYLNWLNTDGHKSETGSRSASRLGIIAGQAEDETRPSLYDQVGNLFFNPWLTPLLLIVGLLLGFPLLALIGLGLFAFRHAIRRVAAPAESFVLLIVTLGCAICFGTEIIYIRDVFSDRMNTIFKFYYQVWLLWGTVTAYALWWILAHLQQRQRVVSYGVSIFFVLLLAGGLVYPVINVRDMLTRGTFVGLAGTTPREHTPAGRASIEWLRQNVTSGSVVLEMVGPGGGSYSPEGFAGISASTGLPTVLGWGGHQSQWRGGDAAALAELDPRQTDVDLIYSTVDLDQARELLDKYAVSYIYIGDLERQHYSPESLAKFDYLGQPVFVDGTVTIYKLHE